MNKIKKIGISILATLIGALAVCNLSNAEYKIGEKVTLNYMNDYVPNKNIICVERNQDFGTYYSVISKLSITGTKSTDYHNHTEDNIENAKFAYILYANSKMDYPKYPSVARELELGQQSVYASEYNWMNSVGKKHYARRLNAAGKEVDVLIGMDFIGSNSQNYKPSQEIDPKGQVTKLIAEANEYANNIKEQRKYKDNTNKDNIKVNSFEKNGKKYFIIGDFNWSFSGNLKEIKAYDQDNKKIDNILYIKYTGTTPQEVSIDKIKSSDNFCIAIPEEAKVSSIKRITGLQEIDSYNVDITFLEATNGLQNLIIAEPKKDKEPIEMPFDYDIKLFGNLKVIKVVKGNEIIKLQNVGFIIQNSDTQKYVKETNKQISYVDKKEDATEFVTDANGEITIKNLTVGNYTAYETKNPNDVYEIIKDGISTKVVVDKTAELKIPNKQKYIKLSGYVWVDRISGKQSTRNNLYKDGEYDSNDILLDGITVRLKNKETGETVKEVTTSNGGAYKFIDVLVDDLEKYYVEFEYDGLTYQNVPSVLDKNNGSKSAENVTKRSEFNNSFAVVEGGETDTTGITKDLNGNVTHNLSYTRSTSEGEQKTTLNKGNYLITATTDETGYSIKNHYTPGQEEIKYINLGLYEREMPDIRIEKDVENVELSINGFSHVYEYGSKKLDNYDMQKDESGFNVGVKFASEYKGTYKRAVYEPDYNYTIQNPDKDNKLNVYLTYKIAMYNESTNLKAKVNSIVDYFNNNLTILKIGTEINKETGEIIGDGISVPQTTQQGDYNKVIIQNNTMIDAEKSKSIYVRFKLSDEEVLTAFNDDRNGNITYKNIAEVNSYSVYDAEGKVYAGIDKDSAPANAIPENDTTYEDDTNNAPGIQLDVQGNRTINGSVFLDESTGGIAQVRLGDGIYDSSKEQGIKGVNVKLTEVDENGNVKVNGQTYTSTTGDNGTFTISNFIPGNYILTYIWGDKTYNVKDYKSTIWTTPNKAEKDQNGNNWYKVNTDTRYSDAMDNWETRQKIDNEEEISTMEASTPTMSLGFEVNSVYSTVVDVDRFVPEGYDIKNIDFGIVERARQQLDITKKVKTFKAYLGSQLIVDAEIDENGELKGSKNNLIYMKPSPTTSPSYGKLWLQLDSELMSSTEVKIGYEISVKNNSEKEYITENFYKYGVEGNKGELIKIKPEGVYDYLNGTDMRLEEQSTDIVNNGRWEVVSKEEYNRKYEKPTLVEKQFLSSDNKITDENGNVVNTSGWEVAGNSYQEIYTEWMYSIAESRTVDDVRNVKLADKTILHNEKLEQELEPGQVNTVSLNTSKKLANSNEINLSNEVEITEVSKKTETRSDIKEGRNITLVLSKLYGIAQEVTITPPTGENNNYILIIATTVSALVLLGIGVILIKRKTL